MVDLEASARKLLEDMDGLNVERILPHYADNCIVEYPGALGPLAKMEFAAFLRTVCDNVAAMRIRDIHFAPERIIVQGNVTVIQWVCTNRQPSGQSGMYRGINIVAWRPDGLIGKSITYTDPALVRRYSVGWSEAASHLVESELAHAHA